MEKDPGLRLENIAAPKQSWRQRKLSGSGMRRQHGGVVGSPRGSHKYFLGGTRGVWLSQVGDLSQLPVLTVEREGPGRHRVMLWSTRCPQCGYIAQCGTFQLLVSARLEWASSQVP